MDNLKQSHNNNHPNTTISLEKGVALRYNRPLICLNEPTNHIRDTAPVLTDSVLVSLRKPVALS